MHYSREEGEFRVSPRNVEELSTTTCNFIRQAHFRNISRILVEKDAKSSDIYIKDAEQQQRWRIGS